tara:strand:+ start:27064 stop:27615 length:552 start_codon:yes stop_codon:yes gene_type:complete
MKKITLILLTCFSLSVFSQEKNYLQDVDKKHEIKLNVLGLLTSEWIDVSYEYLINEESSFGLGLQFGLDDNNVITDTYRTFSITPYYRRYFSKKYARGFYVEGFGMLHTFKDDDYYFDILFPTNNVVNEKRTNFALGIAVGGKFVSKGGFIADIFGGLGRNLGNNEYDYDVVGRIGISLGYRF